MPTSKEKPVNAIEPLEEDHEKMAHGDTAELQKLVKLVCKALKAHADIEERLFYPAVRCAEPGSTCKPSPGR